MDSFEKRGKLNSSSGMAVRPVHMNSDTSFPLMGPKQNPCPEWPEAMIKPSIPFIYPRIGRSSADHHK